MIKKVLRIIAGIFLILLGILGLVLPGLQGILLIVAGLYMLGVRFPWLEKKWKEWKAKRKKQRDDTLSRVLSQDVHETSEN